MVKKNLLKRIRQFDKDFSINLKDHVPKKYFNNKIIYGGVFVVFLLSLYALYSAGSLSNKGIDISNKIYYFCPEESIMPCVINATEKINGTKIERTLFLQPGQTYGQVPPRIVKEFDFYVNVIMVSSFIINHLYFMWRKNNGKV